MPFHKIDKNLLRRLCARPELSDVAIAARFGVTRALLFAGPKHGAILIFWLSNCRAAG